MARKPANISKKYENFSMQTLQSWPLTPEQAETIDKAYEEGLLVNEKYINSRMAEIELLKAEIADLKKEAKEVAVNRAWSAAKSVKAWEKVD